MDVIKTKIEGLLILQPKVFHDNRGYFFESYNKDTFESLGIKTNFIQDNQSLSSKGVLRGLHFQKPNRSQIKLVRVINGAIIDVAVDIRKDSKTYGEYVIVELSGENKNMFYIPDGFAHGFLTLQDNTIVQYKCSDTYSKEHEGGLMWNDKTLNINWILTSEPIISDKDKVYEDFINFKTPF